MLNLMLEWMNEIIQSVKQRGEKGVSDQSQMWDSSSICQEAEVTNKLLKYSHDRLWL